MKKFKKIPIKLPVWNLKENALSTRSLKFQNPEKSLTLLKKFLKFGSENFSKSLMKNSKNFSG